ncbi:hypothetical protein CWB96_12395 [Pseudoalteromonas citrea]|uniref:Carrier domain-containing protein n=2 Tax=Pseudoalteromonas citrea TaxID=43655 RepID=A0A5S3XNB6_9GAMM|nr:hypothetical protein CWB97_01945 [Pseudoalteromonas citrea]TMP58163.1 hypothetical protein CWB96_12395 [Pseudoalteromonas citrea]
MRRIRMNSSNDGTVNAQVSTQKKLDNSKKLTYLQGKVTPKTTSCVHQLFEQQVDKTPEYNALVFNNVALSYTQLNQRANQVSHFIYEKSQLSAESTDSTQQRVVLLLPRSEFALICMLGALKAGVCYVPIAPDFPLERVRFILNDVAPSLVITTAELALQFNTLQAKNWYIFDLTDHERSFNDYPISNPNRAVSAQHLAYVIYTSGSTGTPKGVMLEHHSVVNTLQALSPIYGKNDGLNTPLKTSAFTHFVFDVSVSECFCPLIFGHELHLLSDDIRTDSVALSGYITQHRLNVVYLPPSVLATLPRVSYDSVSSFIFAGEPCQKECGEYFAQAYNLYNFYGPTECAIYATGQRVDAQSIHHIGAPIDNMRGYIVNQAGEQVAYGDEGELYLSGRGLARGYLNLETQTHLCFIENPFWVQADDPFDDYRQIYKTGDLVKQQADGQLVYLGRCDQQIKVNGFRIEPGEIEHQLQQYPEVVQSKVVVDPARNQLVAFYTSSHPIKPDEALPAFISRYLPEYMLPKHYIHVHEMPVSISGKIDARALLNQLDPITTENNNTAEHSQMLELLLKTVSGVLNISNIAGNDSFYQLGGDSILAMHIGAKLHEHGVSCSPVQVLQSKTFYALADKLENEEGSAAKTCTLAVNDGVFNPMQRLILNHQLSTSAILYNENLSINFSAAGCQTIKLEQLQHALMRLINHHDILRMRVNEDNLGYQIGARLSTADDLITLLNVPEELGGQAHKHVNYHDATVDEALARSIDRPFDMHTGPLYRFIALCHEGHVHQLIFIHHHLLTDGEAMYNLFVPQLAEVLENPACQLPLVPRTITQTVYKEADDTLIASLNTATLFNNQHSEKPHGKFKTKTFSTALSDQLFASAKAQEVSVFSVLLACIQLITLRFSNQDSVSIGGVRSLRHPDAQNVYGNFLANELYYCDRDPNTSVTDFIAQCFAQITQQLANPLAYDALLKKVRENYTVEEKLPSVYMTLEPQKRHDVPWVITQNNMLPSQVKYPLYFEFDMQDTLSLRVEYRTAIYSDTQIQQLITAVEHVLTSFSTQLERPVGDINLMSVEQRTCLLEKYTAAVPAYPENDLVSQFVAMAERAPTKCALMCAGKKASYADIDKASNQLAQYLIENNHVRAESLVLLLLEPSFDTIVSILAVLKAGGAYVPIDPTYPTSRIRYIAEDTASQIVITNSTHSERIATLPQLTRICLDTLPAQHYSDERPNITIVPEQLAYVIYTSGSTGQPKGVQITHNNVSRLLSSSNSHFNFTPDDVWCLFHSYVFDFSVWEIWGSLLHGGSLLIPSKQQTQDTTAFFQLVKEHKISVLNQTPSAFYNFIQEASKQAQLEHLRYVIFGGEALNLVQLQPWFDLYGYRDPTLVNMYGITETCVHVTFKAISPADIGERSNIGMPLNDLSAYILDDNLNPVPQGVVAQLYVSGGGVARGYLNKTSLTGSRFVANPHNQNAGQAILYKTGDLVRELDSGGIEYIGRNDFQVKIRGYRIELGEIEHCVSQIAGVIQNTVLAKKRDSGQYLVAYYVADSDIAHDDFIQQLSSRLPAHMVPQHFVYMPSMPLTINGKVDVRNFPEPNFTQADHCAPSTETEHAWCAIWADVMSVEQVGIEDDFFRIGGDSINAIRVVAQLKSKGFSVSVRDIFQYKTVKRILDKTNEGKPVNTAPYTATPKYLPFSLVNTQLQSRFAQLADVYPATHLQQGMFVECKRDGRIYHNLDVSEVNQPFDITRFTLIWQALVNKHELLRAAYQQFDDMGYLTLVEHTLDVAKHIVQYSDYEQAWDQESNTPIVLDEAGLFRLAIVPAQTQFKLIFTSHHAIEDGWSVASLIAEFISAYTQKSTDEEVVSSIESRPIAVNFGQYVKQEIAVINDPLQRQFWRRYLEDMPEQVHKMRSKAVAKHEPVMIEQTCELTAYMHQAVLDMALQHGVSVDSVFMAAFVHLLRVFNGSDDVTLGVVVNNRLEVEGGDEQFGLHLNTMPMRFNSVEAELVKAVYQEKLHLMEHKNYPYGQIKSDLGIEPDQDLYQAAFNYIHFYQKHSALKASAGEAIDAIAMTNIPIALVVNREGNTFDIQFQAHSTFIEQAQLEYLAEYYQHYLSCILSSEPLQSGMRSNEHISLRQQVDTYASFDKKDTVLDMWQHTVAQYSDEVALCFQNEQFTYLALDKQADQVAGYLSEEVGVRLGDTVAISFERSSNMIIAMLAAVKLGVVYVPVDPAYPMERVRYILKDCGASAVLCCDHVVNVLAFIQEDGVHLVDITSKAVKMAAYKWAGRPVDLAPQSLVNIIYTSGTTGQPKGVMISHAGVVNLVHSQRQMFSLTHTDNVLQFASISFDAATWEIYSTLCSGSTLVVCDKTVRKDAKALAQMLSAEQVSIATLPPVLVETLDESDCNSLRILVVAGETTPDKTLRRFSEVCQVINAYGPTETTVCCSFHRYKVGDLNTNIGKPLLNTCLYILDQHMNSVPKGVVGRLFVSGSGVAAGYFKRPELTAQKFIANHMKDDDFSVLYDTGDLARYDLNNDIEYLGRSDFQVKIRGYRVELGEIEQVLSKCQGIAQSTVQLLELNQQKVLSAYFTSCSDPTQGHEVTVESWQQVYDAEYSRLEKDLTVDQADFEGWNSTYTGMPIDVEKMHEWRDATVARLKTLPLGNVLEIGSGSGLIFYPLIEHCTHYFATDFSKAAIDKLGFGAKQLGFEHKAQFAVCDAAKIYDAVAAQNYVPDTIIINSVAQYFPSFDYLMEVIEQASQLIAKGGLIFIGDVRDARLLDTFHYDVQKSRASDVPHNQLKQLASQARVLDKELLISPAFFAQLPSHFTLCTDAQTMYKSGSHSSEMTDYRYDALLSFSTKGVQPLTPHVIEYTNDVTVKEQVALHQHLVIEGVPNERVYQAYVNYYNLPCKFSAPLNWQNWVDVAQSLGCGIRFMPNDSAAHLMSVSLIKNDVNSHCEFASINQPHGESLTHTPLSHYVREPVVEINTQTLIESLKTQLPAHLIPQHFVQLEQIPLTTHGKIDKKALPTPELCSVDYQAPHTELEQTLCHIWQTTLSIARVGVNDDFFRLGGNSILAITLCHRMSQALDYEVNVAILFKCSTISALIDDGLYLQKNKIEPAKIDNPPLSFAQQRLWFIEQYEQGSAAYTVPIALTLTVDAARFTQAVKCIIERHQVLRTCFDDKSESEKVLLDIRSADEFTPVIETVAQHDWRARIAQDMQYVFDLTKELPVRLSIYQDTSDVAALINIHHIAFDGWSVDILLKELELLLAPEDEQSQALAKLPIQYQDYAYWQHTYLQQGELARQLSYWQTQLQGFETLNLPLDHPRPEQLSYVGKNLNQVVKATTTKKLKALARAHSVTLYTLLLSVFNVLLHRYSGQTDITLGSPAANRTSYDTQDLIGFFVNAQPIRNQLDPVSKFDEFLAQVHNTVIKAQAHQDVPFESIVEHLSLERDASRHPIFQVMFSVQNFGEEANKSAFFTPIDVDDIYQVAKHDLTVFVNDSVSQQSENELKLLLNFNTALFSDARIDNLAQHYVNLLEAICEAPDSPINELAMFTPVQRQQLLNASNRPHAAREQCALAERFDTLSAQYADTIALQCDDTRLTYQQLDVYSTQIAQQITTKLAGVAAPQKQPRVVLLMDRSITMLVSLIAIMRAGAVYVPIDADAPSERIEYIVTDSAATLLLTQPHLLAALPELATDVAIGSVETKSGIDGVSCSQQPLPESNIDDLAYVIYTSGTTGQPKGVMVTHGCVGHYVDNITEIIAPGMKVDFSSNIGFDLSVTTTLAAVLRAAHVHIFPHPVKYVDEYRQYLTRHDIEFVKMVPSLAELVFSSDTKVRVDTLMLGGEKLLSQQVSALKAHCHVVLDEYGPTETTVGCCISQRYPVKNEGIGAPYANTRVYVLDSQLEPVVQGASGYLYVSGPGVAAGYLNLPEQTKAAFINNPFVAQGDYNGLYDRLYFTGDLVKVDRASQLHYLGRSDAQIKLRGYRIELHEIEQQLLSLECITQVAVTLKQQGRREWLAAFYVSEQVVTHEQFVDLLSDRLPHYMIPSQFIALSELPLTANGKVNHEALPTQDLAQAQFQAPSNKTEQQISDIWQSLLNVERVSTLDNFFQIGGDSISSITLVSKLRKAGFTFAVKDVFTHSTVQAQAKYVLSGHSSTTVLSQQGELVGKFSLLPVQQRFFDDVQRGLITQPEYWNQSFLIQVPPIDIVRLQQALNELVAHHDMLRTSFDVNHSGRPVRYQSYEKARPIGLRIIDMAHTEPEALPALLNEVQQDKEVCSGAILSVAYIREYTHAQDAIFVSCHHLAIDTVSWQIFSEDLHALYFNRSLPEKTTSYRQWVDVMHQYEGMYPSEGAYWQHVLAQDESLKELVLHTEPSHSFDAEIRLQVAETELLLAKSNAAYGTQINDLLLCAFAYALHQVNQCHCQLITLEGHGRELLDHLLDERDVILDTSRTIGWFTTHYPVALPIADSLSLTIRAIKECLRKVENKGIGFGACQVNDASLILPPIAFNYLGVISTAEQSADWQIALDDLSTQVSQENNDGLLISVNGAVDAGELMFSIATKLDAKAHHLLCNAFEQTLHDIVQHCTRQASFTRSPSDIGVDMPIEEFDKITAVQGISEVFGATSLQQGMIYQHVSFPDSDAYHVQFLIDYDEPLVVPYYQQAWQWVVDEYPALRMYFDWQHAPVQLIQQEVDVNFIFHDWSAHTHVDAAITLLQREDRNHPFNLNQAGLLRLQLIKRGESSFTLLRSEHHSVSDGWSNARLMARVHQVYSQLCQGATPHKREDSGYVNAQHFYVSQREACKQFWLREKLRFDECNDISSMLSCASGLATHKHVEAAEQAFISFKATHLQQVARDSNVTMHSILQLAWHKLIRIYSASSQTMVGTTVSGRGIDVDGIEDSVGLYINTLPLCVQWDNDNTVLQQLQAITQSMSLLNTHSHQPLAQLQQGAERLFQTVLIHENYPEPQNDGTARLNFSYRAAFEKVDYPIAVIAQEQQNTLTLGLSYDTALLSEERAKHLLAQFEQMLHAIPRYLTRHHGQLNALTPAQRYDALAKANQTYVAFEPEGIEQLFYQQARIFSALPAVTFAGKTLTYQALNEASNQLAHYLLQHLSVQPDSLIAIAMDRSIEMVISILAVIKAGGAYVPIDPQGAIERAHYILQDTEALAVLTQSSYHADFKQQADNIRRDEACTLKVFTVDNPEIYTMPKHNVDRPLSAERLAYVIYTSGTTGQPKGVMIEHNGVVNLIESQMNTLGLTQESKVLQFSNLVFDASVFEIFPALIAGAELHLIDPSLQRDLVGLVEYIEQQKITCAFLSTALVKLLKGNEFSSLEVIHTGGEALDGLAILPNSCRLINQYGPTEGTVCCAQAEITDLAELPIGTPIQNMQMFVLDPHLQPVERGVVGELYIAGPGVARGYLNQPALTSLQFIDNPFKNEADLQTSYNTLYKTGDRVRLSAKGQFEYIGRADFQVKVRGYRVELEEIEHRLAQHDAINHCVVKVLKVGGVDSLVGYYNAERELDANVLMSHLQKGMPSYMIPSVFMYIARFSYTSSGKINRHALPEPDVPRTAFVAPSTESQRAICTLFAETLSIKSVGITDDFFTLGGNSILAITVCQKLTEQFGINIRVADLFEHQSVAQLDEYLMASSQVEEETGEF